MRKALSLLLLFLLQFFHPFLNESSFAYDNKEIVRILLCDNLESVRIKGTKDFAVFDSDRDQAIENYSGPEEVELVVKDSSLFLNGKRQSTRIIILKGKGEETLFSLNNKVYRGDISVKLATNQRLQVINTLDLERYLYGVVPAEISPRWEMNAIMAQAIAARTYTLWRKMMNQGNGYDLTATIMDQIYAGFSGEKSRTNEAVDMTRGMVLKYKGNIIPAYYHADCGGATEDGIYVWNKDLPFLKSVKCPFDMDSPYQKWSLDLGFDDFLQALKRLGYTLEYTAMKVFDLSPMAQSPSGRTLLFQIRYPPEGDLILKGKELRAAIGPNLMKSTLIDEVRVNGKTITLKGRGWGHGTGLSQWCAKVMAEKGFTYKEILNYFYNDVDISLYQP